MTSPEHAKAVLAATISQSMQQALQAHRVYVETLAEQNIRDGSVGGFVDIDGEGECIAQISFPITFLQRPLFTAGLELPDNIWLQWGSFPTWSATVGAWDTQPTSGDLLYRGATVGVYVAGVTKSVLHYKFEAQSFANPLGDSLAVGTTL